MPYHNTLPICAIRTDGGTQTRTATDDDAIEDYAERYRAELEMPPVVVFFDGTDHWLADGFHRLAAAALAGRGEIPTDLRPGTVQDARRYAIGANQAHGVRLTNADKRRKIGMALDDPEWASLSDREIARRCGVDHKTVATVRRERADASPSWVVRREERARWLARHRTYRITPDPNGSAEEQRRERLILWDVFHGRAWEGPWSERSSVSAFFALIAVSDFEELVAAGEEPGDYLIPGACTLAECTIAIRDALVPGWWDLFVRAELDDFGIWSEIERIAALPHGEQQARLAARTVDSRAAVLARLTDDEPDEVSAQRARTLALMGARSNMAWPQSACGAP